MDVDMNQRREAFKAVVFDFDGVIVDTEPLHYEAFQRVLAPEGIALTWPEYLGKYVGFDDRDGFREILKDAGRPLKAEELPGLVHAKAAAFQALVHEKGAKPYPGVVHLIRMLRARLPLGLCSGALPGDILPILAMLGLDGSFGVMVTAEDVEASKPDPACYALAVRRLAAAFPTEGIEPSSTLAIEDTPTGIASARDAGLSVLAIANTHARASLTQARWILDSFEGAERLLADLGLA